MTRKRLAKKKKVVHSDLSNDNSTRDGIIPQHGSTAGGRPHISGIFTDGHSIHNLSPPATSHWAPGTTHLQQSLVNQSLVIQAPVIKWWTWGTGHQSLSANYQARALVNKAPVTSHLAPSLGTGHQQGSQGLSILPKSKSRLLKLPKASPQDACFFPWDYY